MRILSIAVFIISPFLLSAQQVLTIAGMLEVVGATDGSAFESSFNNPHGIAMDNEGNAYVVDRFGHKVRKYSQDGNVTTLAGSGIIGDSDGVGLNATFNEPWGVCVGNDGNIYVADTRNNLIRKITPEGEVTTIAGTGNFGSTNGAAMNATFGNPTGLEMDDDGNLYIADHLTHVIRKITPAGFVSTVAGVGGSPGFVDGNGTNALFNRPYGLTLDINGDILVADEWNHRIRRVSPFGQVTTVAGTGIVGHADGDPSIAEYNYPWDITVDDQGNIFVADGYNQVIRKLIPTGSIPESYNSTTYVGSPGQSGGFDGLGTEATFNAATSIHFWPQTGEIYVADAYNNLLRKIIDINRPVVELEMVNLQGVDPGNTYFCKGMELDFDASPDTLLNYAFYVNGQLVQNGPATIYSTADLPVGENTITVAASDGIGLINSNIITLNIEESLIQDFTATELMLDENNEMTSFEAFLNNEEGISYFWNFGDPVSDTENFSDLARPDHQYTQGGIYTVSLIVENEVGCIDTLIKEDMIVYTAAEEEPILFVPNAFTPNGDGENDFLYVRGEQIANLEFYVYNQWGELVFETADPSDGWDGIYKGKPASNCSYTYLVKAEMANGDQEVLSGHVSIIR